MKKNRLFDGIAKGSRPQSLPRVGKASDAGSMEDTVTDFQKAPEWYTISNREFE